MTTQQRIMHGGKTTLDGTRPSSDTLAALARPGLVAHAVLYVTIGLLAIGIARSGRTGRSADGTGAVETLADQPYGLVLLVLLVVGLAALALWRTAQTVWGDPVSGSEPADRARYAARAVAYAAVAVSAVGVLVRGDAGRSGDQQAQSWTATAMAWPGGRLLVAVAGLGLVAYGLHSFWHRAVKASFADDLDRGRMGRSAERAITRLGQVGCAGRSMVFLLVGGFLVQAAVTFDSDEAKGLSESLQELARSGWWPLLWLTAVGLFAYGLLSLALARYRRVR